MNKLQMAHEYAMKHVQEGFDINYDVLVVEAWKYADAMQAEADKREPSGFPNVLRGACGEIVAVKVDDKEWQPDWSQAPEWANWWAMDSNGICYWYMTKPRLAETFPNEWISGGGPMDIQAPSFNYQGYWKDSLQERK